MLSSSPHSIRSKSPGAGDAASLLREVHRKTLKNGLRVLLVESHVLPVVSHWLWYTVGSRDERSGETGVSHFLEHMMFKGTDRYPKGSIDTLTARLGGSNNAMTSYDYTTYYFNLKSDRWTEALEIEASRMQHCLLDGAEFEAEKKVVLEELMRGKDEPWSPLWEAVSSMAYLVHPYHHPIIGWREELERMPVETMRSYYERHYAPDRGILVVVGDIQHEQAMGEIEARLGDIPASGCEREPVLAEPPQQGERRITVRFPGKVSRLAMAWPTCKQGERDDTTLDLLSTVLSTGKSSRLYRGLVKGKEIASWAAAYNETRLDPGLFWMVAEAKPGGSEEELEAALLAELKRIQQEGPSEAELERAKKQILSSFYFDLETVSEQAHKIGRLEATCEGGYEALLRYPAELQSLGAEDVRELACKYLIEDHRCTGWSLPKEL
ncbi:MAG: peptidase M16 [Planctomycetota bacterium]|nr:MAG: peptidase M16 [Planctomycetota bacterium]